LVENNSLNYTIEQFYRVIINISNADEKEENQTRMAVTLQRNSKTGKNLFSFNLLSGNSDSFDLCKNQLMSLY
jgi:hypothetical protein